MWNVANENVDIDYVYCDTDVHSNEMAELYSYTEEPDFAINKTSFEQLMLDYGFPLKWTEMTDHQQDRTLELLADGLELTSKSSRMQSLRAVLYLAQGVFGECSKMFEQEDLSRKNTFILYSKGFFTLSLQLLLLEIDITLSPTTPKKLPSHLGDSRDMRLILSLIYTFVEIIRTGRDVDSEQDVLLRKEFLEELCQPVGPTNELLSITLFQMVTKFCNGSAPQLPVRKVLLLLWKVILATLGGTEKLRSLKDQYRREAGLAPCPDDTVEVARTMRAASPPASAAEVMEAQNQRKINRPFKRQMLIKQPSVASEDSEGDSNDGNDETDAQRVDDSNDADVQVRKNNPPEEKLDIGARPASPRPSNAGQFPVLSRLASAGEHSEFPLLSKGLPWAPKVRHRDLDQFLDHTRSKFIGYLLPGDRSTTAGLPGPILEGIKILRQHMYVSLTEVQTRNEDDLLRYPLTKKEDTLSSLASPTEALYQAMLPSLTQYMIALLKILLAAAPTSKAKTDSINIMAEILPEEMPMSVIQSMKLGIDVNRHKEIIIKAISAILLLLLKHFKINHVYQFEYMSQQLMFANCIPLVLKFFNQNINQYVSAKTSISLIDFPACVIGDQTELTVEAIEMPDLHPYTWRSMFSCINLLRILNKLTKWKHSRIMMLVVFKSAPILKRALKLRHAMLQLYVLKLLKMQAKYLGRQWRKSNMKTMSAIYQKVRHRITDDWAYGNDLDARPWDFQAEEFALQANINRFHHRRYGKTVPGVTHPSAPPTCHNVSMDANNMAADDFFQSVDTSFLSVINCDIELTNEFKHNYETWLDREVFQFGIDWDQLLLSTNTSDM